MKLLPLSPDHLLQLTNLLDNAQPDHLWLEAPALAELRVALSGPGFLPRVYVGIEGGLVHGATGNCAMQLVACDYDVEGSAPHERRFLRAFQSTGVPAEHVVAVDAEVCDSLLSDALGQSDEQQVAALVDQIKAELRNDGFEVAQAPDGRWYSADEQDRAEVTAGEYHTESLAWRDLAASRRHVLEDANLAQEGVFTAVASSAYLAQQYRHDSADSATILHTAVLEGAEYELRICGAGSAAYLEWTDELGDPVGSVFEEVDFDQVEASLTPTARQGTAPM